MWSFTELCRIFNNVEYYKAVARSLERARSRWEILLMLELHLHCAS
jgi:hypothetical protein